MPGITLRVAERSNHGGDKGLGKFLSGGSCEGVKDGNIEDESEELEGAAL